MDMIPLSARVRADGDRPNALRAAGQVPCVLYGNDVKNTSIQCARGEVLKAYSLAGKSTLVDLDTGGRKIPVLFHAIDFDPVTDAITHVDFYAVDMKKEIGAEVPISFTGESPAVKELGAIFVSPHDHVKVKCLPAKLPHELTAGIESLVGFGDTLHVSDIRVPDGVKIEDSPGIVIATVQEPRKEEVIETAASADAGGVSGEAAAGEKEAEGTEESRKAAEGDKTTSAPVRQGQRA